MSDIGRVGGPPPIPPPQPLSPGDANPNVKAALDTAAELLAQIENSKPGYSGDSWVITPSSFRNNWSQFAQEISQPPLADNKVLHDLFGKIDHQIGKFPEQWLLYASELPTIKSRMEQCIDELVKHIADPS